MALTNEEIAFITGIATIVSGIITFMTRAILKSNCTHCKCCGAECARATTHEPRELEINPVATI